MCEATGKLCEATGHAFKTGQVCEGTGQLLGNRSGALDRSGV